MPQDPINTSAYSVVQGLLLVARDQAYGALVPHESVAVSRRILSASEEGRRRLGQLEHATYRWAAHHLERWFTPGITLHYALRKRYIEDQVRLAIDAGVSQVIWLGSGFDTLAWRLHIQHPVVNFIELDHPATSMVKQRALALKKADNLELLAVTLAQVELHGALRNSRRFNPARRTLFVCEEALITLPPREVSTLFRAIRRITGSGTHLLFCALEPSDGEAIPHGPLLRLLRARTDAPPLWLVREGEMDAFLHVEGYQRLESCDATALQSRYLVAREEGHPACGEYLVLASIA